MEDDSIAGEANALQDVTVRPLLAETVQATADLEIGERGNQPPRTGWEVLNNDVKEVIHSKFTLRGLARLGETSREFQKAYRTMLTHERASIIQIAEQSFGPGLFCALVKALRRSMYGQRPCPGLLHVDCFALEPVYAGQGFSSKRHIRINDAGEPNYVALHEARSTQACLGPCAVISEANAWLFPGRMVSEPSLRPRTFMKLQKKWNWENWNGEDYFQVVMDEEVLVATLGLLTAVYAQEPEARPASFPGPLNFEFWIRKQKGSPVGKASELVGPMRVKDVVAPLREAENLVALLRSFAKSITIHRNVSPNPWWFF